MIYPLTFQHSQNVPCEKKSIIVDNYLNVKFNIQYLFLSTNFEINFSAVDSHRSLSKQRPCSQSQQPLRQFTRHKPGQLVTYRYFQTVTRYSVTTWLCDELTGRQTLLHEPATPSCSQIGDSRFL